MENNSKLVAIALSVVLCAGIGIQITGQATWNPLTWHRSRPIQAVTSRASRAFNWSKQKTENVLAFVDQKFEYLPGWSGLSKKEKFVAVTATTTTLLSLAATYYFMKDDLEKGRKIIGKTVNLLERMNIPGWKNLFKGQQRDIIEYIYGVVLGAGIAALPGVLLKKAKPQIQEFINRWTPTQLKNMVNSIDNIIGYIPGWKNLTPDTKKQIIGGIGSVILGVVAGQIVGKKVSRMREEESNKALHQMKESLGL